MRVRVEVAESTGEVEKVEGREFFTGEQSSKLGRVERWRSREVEGDLKLGSSSLAPFFPLEIAPRHPLTVAHRVGRRYSAAEQRQQRDLRGILRILRV